MLTTVDLFSGIGGFARGLEATGHFRTTCFVEQDPYCQAVLKHHWPDVPILDDIKNAKAFDFPDTRPDLVCGGFPCQPFSQAGRQRAQDDPRHLWPEMLRVIRELRPTWVVGENVVGLIKLGLDEVLTDLEGEGYATRTFNIPACATGAPHLRQRVWVVAHADSESEPDGNAGQRQFGFGGQDVADPNRSGQCEQRGSEPVQEEQSASECTGEDVADAQRKREGRRGVSGPGQDKSEDGKGSSSQPRGHGEAGSEDHWISEPAVGRLVNGLPNRVSQLRALGNSIVPQIAQEIGQAIRIAHDVSKEN
jgi:DNA (cytosine-5)-methyltransferase 1